jgi:hypothetical protein
LLFTVLLVSVSSATYAKNASAIYFGNNACPSGELRDYMGICFPKNECKSGLFAAAGTCKDVTVPECTKVNGETRCTVGSTALNPGRSPLSPLAGENEHSLKNIVNNPVVTLGSIAKTICGITKGSNGPPGVNDQGNPCPKSK